MLPDYDATGIEPSAQGQAKLMPRGWFKFEVISYTTKDGSKTYPMDGFTNKNHYPKTDLLTECISEGEYKGCRVFHTVTFMPKGVDGAGMAIHWLKTIGQPYEGKIKPNSSVWPGAIFMGYPIVDEYMGKKKNKFGEIKACEEYNDPEIQKAAETNDLPY